MMSDIWEDGICKSCGSVVMEMASIANRDYKNWCSNEDCQHHKTHYCFDDEFLDYYEHKGIDSPDEE